MGNLSNYAISARLIFFLELSISGVIEKPHVPGLFKNVQMQGAQITEPRGVYGYTLSDVVCSATQHMSVFQQPLSSCFFIMIRTAEIAPSVMPGILSIWPIVAGAIRVSLTLSSLDNPGMEL